MLGHYLLTLTEAQEDRVLGRPFEPVLSESRRRLGLPSLDVSPGCQCLVLCATDGELVSGGTPTSETAPWHHVPGMRYEVLCERFGVRRINAAIRNRILSNRARRALTRELGSVGAVPGRPQ